MKKEVKFKQWVINNINLEQQINNLISSLEIQEVISISLKYLNDVVALDIFYIPFKEQVKLNE